MDNRTSAKYDALARSFMKVNKQATSGYYLWLHVRTFAWFCHLCMKELNNWLAAFNNSYHLNIVIHIWTYCQSASVMRDRSFFKIRHFPQQLMVDRFTSNMWQTYWIHKDQLLEYFWSKRFCSLSPQPQIDDHKALTSTTIFEKFGAEPSLEERTLHPEY